MAARTVPVTFAVGARADAVVAAYTTRHGGVSRPPFASLNCGFSAGDDPVAVRENRRRALEPLGLDAGDLVVGGQVHGTRVAPVAAAERGRGAAAAEDVLPDTDGLLTATPDLPVAVLTADCVPVFLWAPGAGVAGLLHAGWRGTLRGILPAALDRLRRTWDVAPADLCVAFGPSIGACCFEVGREVADEARAHPATGDTLRSTGPDSWHLDLRGHLRAQCVAAGVPAARVRADAPCSRCDTATYFSYRGEGPRSGRTLSVIAVRGPA